MLFLFHLLFSTLLPFSTTDLKLQFSFPSCYPLSPVLSTCLPPLSSLLNSSLLCCASNPLLLKWGLFQPCCKSVPMSCGGSFILLPSRSTPEGLSQKVKSFIRISIGGSRLETPAQGTAFCLHPGFRLPCTLVGATLVPISTNMIVL